MPFLGFNDESIKWYKSYLSNRKFMISIQNSYSDKASIKSSVPQGSVLGPLISLVYINDILLTMDSELLSYALSGLAT